MVSSRVPGATILSNVGSIRMISNGRRGGVDALAGGCAWARDAKASPRPAVPAARRRCRSGRKRRARLGEVAGEHRREQQQPDEDEERRAEAVSYTHLRAHETPEHLVCR